MPDIIQVSHPSIPLSFLTLSFFSSLVFLVVFLDYVPKTITGYWRFCFTNEVISFFRPCPCLFCVCVKFIMTSCSFYIYYGITLWEREKVGETDRHTDTQTDKKTLPLINRYNNNLKSITFVPLSNLYIYLFIYLSIHICFWLVQCAHNVLVFI